MLIDGFLSRLTVSRSESRDLNKPSVGPSRSLSKTSCRSCDHALTQALSSFLSYTVERECDSLPRGSTGLIFNDSTRRSHARAPFFLPQARRFLSPLEKRRWTYSLTTLRRTSLSGAVSINHLVSTKRPPSTHDLRYST